MSERVGKFITTSMTNYITEQKVSKVVYRKSVDEEKTEIGAFVDNKRIGHLVMEVLFEAYEYDFADVFDEDTFNEMYPDSAIVKIEYIDIDDAYKGMGIGTELMKRGMALMKKNGYTQFFLNASPMGFSGLGTVDLVEFYKKFGFKELLNQGHNVLMGVNFDKTISENTKSNKNRICNNVLCFSRALTKKKFVVKNGEFKVRVLIKGDGEESDRTFDIEVPLMTGLRQDFETAAEYRNAIEDYKDYETTVIGWNLHGEETDMREIFYSEISEILQDLNK